MAEHFTLSEPEVKEIWQHLCHTLQLQVSPAVFNTWILSNPVTKIELVGDTHALCTITSPTAFHSTNFKKNLSAQIITSLGEILGRQVELTYVVGTPVSTPAAAAMPAFTRPLPPPPMATPSTPLGSAPLPTGASTSPRVEDLFSEHSLQSAALDRVEVTARQVGLRPDYTFETFAVSTTNEMAHAAASAVSQRPGVAYNPLFLYGGVGVGKTHLMHAIGHNILKANPATAILYCTGEEFTNEIVSAIQTKKALKFKEKYRKTQVLLIDDIQFIAGKTAVQEEFFHTFNALTQQAHQIVLTSDRPPHEINLLEDRLRSRFEAGLMIDIGQPSFELRTAILLIKSRAVNITIPMDIAQLIASKVDSARRIEGFLKRLKSAIELQKKEVSEELVEDILKSEGQQSKQRIKVAPQDVIKAVANHYHVKQTALKGKRRVQSLVTARHVAMYLLKEELQLPLTEIGRWFSNRDHTTALHATRKIEEQMQTDGLLQRDISALRMSLTAISH